MTLNILDFGWFCEGDENSHNQAIIGGIFNFKKGYKKERGSDLIRGVEQEVLCGWF